MGGKALLFVSWQIKGAGSWVPTITTLCKRPHKQVITLSYKKEAEVIEGLLPSQPGLELSHIIRPNNPISTPLGVSAIELN